MNLKLESYEVQQERWPKEGFHLMAQYNEETIVVYQSYKKEIGQFAAKNQFFGAGFSMDRMTWIKPNFLWMMFRNGWGTKEDQECVLAIHLKRTAFESYLWQGVYSTFGPRLGLERAEWDRQIKQSSVRLQWDPDHDPYGRKLERRAIQIGLRAGAVREYATKDICQIEDITEFVQAQHQHVQNHELSQLQMPLERPLIFDDPALNTKLRLQMP